MKHDDVDLYEGLEGRGIAAACLAIVFLCLI